MADLEVEKQNAVKRKLESESVVMKKSEKVDLSHDDNAALGHEQKKNAMADLEVEKQNAVKRKVESESVVMKKSESEVGPSPAVSSNPKTASTSSTVKCKDTKDKAKTHSGDSNLYVNYLDVGREVCVGKAQDYKKRQTKNNIEEHDDSLLELARGLDSCESALFENGLKNEQDDAMSDDDMPLSSLLNGKRAGSSTRTGVKKPPQVESTQSGLRQSSRVRMPVVRFAVQCDAPPKKKVKVDDKFSGGKKPESKEAATIRIRRLEAALEEARAAIEATNGKNAANISKA